MPIFGSACKAFLFGWIVAEAVCFHWTFLKTESLIEGSNIFKSHGVDSGISDVHCSIVERCVIFVCRFQNTDRIYTLFENYDIHNGRILDAVTRRPC